MRSYVTLTVLRLSQAPRLRISGVVTDTVGNPLSRLVLLYDEAHNIIAQTWSGADGAVRFEVDGNTNNRFTARAIGNVVECDDISCPIMGEP